MAKPEKVELSTEKIVSIIHQLIRLKIVIFTIANLYNRLNIAAIEGYVK